MWQYLQVVESAWGRLDQQARLFLNGGGLRNECGGDAHAFRSLVTAARNVSKRLSTRER